MDDPELESHDKADEERKALVTVGDAARNVPILHLHLVYTVRNCLDQCTHLSSV